MKRGKNNHGRTTGSQFDDQPDNQEAMSMSNVGSQDDKDFTGKNTTQHLKQMNITRAKLQQTIKANNLDKLFGIDDMILNKKYDETEVIDEKKELLETLKDLRKRHDQ